MIFSKKTIIASLIALIFFLSGLNILLFVYKGPVEASGQEVTYVSSDDVYVKYKYILKIDKASAFTDETVTISFGVFKSIYPFTEYSPYCSNLFANGGSAFITVSGSGNTFNPRVIARCLTGFGQTTLSTTVGEYKKISITNPMPSFTVPDYFFIETTFQTRPQPPTATLSCAQASIERGQSTNLNWSTSNATSVYLDPGVGTINASGSIPVSPPSTTTYTLTATNTTGTVTAKVTISVTEPPPYNPTPSPTSTPNSNPTPKIIIGKTATPVSNSISIEKSEIKKDKDNATANGQEAITFTITIKNPKGKVVKDKKPIIEVSGTGNTVSDPTLEGDSWNFSVASVVAEDKDVTIKVDQTVLGKIKIFFANGPKIAGLKDIKINNSPWSKGMEIPRFKPADQITISGKTEPLNKITLIVNSEEQSAETTADSNGNWSVELTQSMTFSNGIHEIKGLASNNFGNISDQALLAMFVFDGSAEIPEQPSSLIVYLILIFAILLVGLLLFFQLKRKKSPGIFKNPKSKPVDHLKIEQLKNENKFFQLFSFKAPPKVQKQEKEKIGYQALPPSGNLEIKTSPEAKPAPAPSSKDQILLPPIELPPPSPEAPETKEHPIKNQNQSNNHKPNEDVSQ